MSEFRIEVIDGLAEPPRFRFETWAIPVGRAFRQPIGTWHAISL